MEELLTGRAAVVVAHPDDEVIGAGLLLAALPGVTIIHTTNGSPRNPEDALRSGFGTPAEYQAARRRELACALRLAHVDPQQAISLDFTDQETLLHLPALCRSLEETLRRVNPSVVLTHPYEGGHPDHDSTVFAVHRVWRGPLWEMTSYHAGPDGLLEAGVFLPNGEQPFARPISESDAARKREMLACFVSQQDVLRNFPVVPEQFRRAPGYDFTQTARRRAAL